MPHVCCHRIVCNYCTATGTAGLQARVFQTIVSNPPYIVKDDPHLTQGDLRFEPINALTDHADGPSAYRTSSVNRMNILRNKAGC
jgi:release factor glutamine methyltransferase